MKTLAKFREKIPGAGGAWGYRMDNEGGACGMAEHADLLHCNCCDYFRAIDGAAVLIETTALMRWKEAKEKEYAFLGAQADEFVWRLVKSENRLKIYGGMLVLCRHARRSPEVAEMTGGEECKFWLVVSDATGPQVGRIFRNLRAELRQELCHGPRRRKILAGVEVFGIDRLKGMLPPE